MEPRADVDIPCITPDVDSFFEKAVSILQARGCRKIAFLNPDGFESQTGRIIETFESRGISTNPCWNQIVHLKLSRTAKNLVQLLMNVAQNERPDGLIIGDDNLVEYATAGLVAAGVSVPEDLQVVAHCNFPWPTPCVVPVQRLGYDAREVMQVAIDYIDAMRGGKTVPQAALIPARFENEIL
jgi:DNA-binding LacI/PurR family transcriptional regulator